MLTLVHWFPFHPASTEFSGFVHFNSLKLDTNQFHIQVLLLVAKVDCDLSIPIPTLKVQGHVEYVDVEIYARCATKRATLKIEFNIFNKGIVALCRVMQGVWHTGIVVYGKEGLGQSKPAYMLAM